MTSRRPSPPATNEQRTERAGLVEWSIRQEAQRLQVRDATTALWLRRRHQWATERISALAATHPQIVLLGGGYDTRALTLPAFCRGEVHIFEVDAYGLLAQKLRWFAAQGLRLPVWTQHVPVALDDPTLPQRLHRAGFLPTQPTLLVIESLFYLLPSTVTACFLDPAWLPLAATSVLLFDCWSPVHGQRHNAQNPLGTGPTPFYPPPFPSHPAAIQQTLTQLGYSLVQITDLAPEQHSLEPQPDWLLIEATVGEYKE